MGLALVSRYQSSAYFCLPEESLRCLGAYSSGMWVLKFWQTKLVNLLKFSSIKYLPQSKFFWGAVLPVFTFFSPRPASRYLKRKGTELYSSIHLAPCSIAAVFLYWQYTTTACTKYPRANVKRQLWHPVCHSKGCGTSARWMAGPSPLWSCGCQSWVACPLLYATWSQDCSSWVSTRKLAFASNSLPGSNFLQDPKCPSLSC